MALSLDNLVRKKSDKPPLMIIYGRGKMGKTTLASEFPNPVFIQTEDGSGILDIMSFKDEPLSSFEEVNDALVALASEEHSFQTLVVDSITQLEPLIWAETCLRNKWNSIEAPGYGKGYIEADVVWREFLAACTWLRDNKGMTIILIAHEVVETFSDPEREDYSKYKMRLHKRAEAMVRERADIVGFINQVVMLDKGKTGRDAAKAKGSGQRTLHLNPRPSFEAGNRYDMPDQILINPGQGYDALAPYMPSHRPAAAEAA